MVVSHGIVGLATTTKTHLECLPVRGIIRLQTGLFRKLLQDQFLALIGAHDGHDREQRAARYRAREEKRGEERIFGFLHLCLLFPPNALSKPPPLRRRRTTFAISRSSLSVGLSTSTTTTTSSYPPTHQPTSLHTSLCVPGRGSD